jgi:two-component system alkaline phosphatase synthesis response regulator PhoP
VSRILVVEDEPGIAFSLKADLIGEGHEVTVATAGDEALQRLTSESFALILLDVMLPGRDGLEVCRDIRRQGIRTPVIMLTARATEAEMVMGLEIGADDYVTKPFSPRELRARVKAALRRGDEAGEASVFRFGDAEVDFVRGEVRREGRPVDISALEFRLLSTFVKHRGRLLSRGHLLDLVWGPGISINDRVVDNHIVSLRRKIEPEPAEPRFLRNIRGLGYRFDA